MSDETHSSFIKTPQQLVVVILLAFVVPIAAIVLLIQFILGAPGADPAAMTPEAVTARIQPVGRAEFGAAGAAQAGPRAGEEIVKAVCAACHQTGAANAPKLGDAKVWGPLVKKGREQLTASVIKGVRAMPPRGGDASLSDLEVARAVVFMANQAGAKFKEPAAPKEAAKPAAKK
jgi:cytochrome c5